MIATPMPKFLLRAAAFLLVLCLFLDSATATAFTLATASSVGQASQEFFPQQALAVPPGFSGPHAEDHAPDKAPRIISGTTRHEVGASVSSTLAASRVLLTVILPALLCR